MLTWIWTHCCSHSVRQETKRLLAAEEEAWKIERQKGLEEIQVLKQSAQEAQQAARAAETKANGASSLRISGSPH
jgi:tellurite resistance protein